MSRKLLYFLTNEVKKAVSLVDFAKKSRYEAGVDLRHSERKFENAQASDEASGRKMFELAEKVSINKARYDERCSYVVKAESLLDDACAEVIEYAIDICVPEAYRKTATADYISGSDSIHVFFGENDCAHYILDLHTKKIKHIKEIKA